MAKKLKIILALGLGALLLAGAGWGGWAIRGDADAKLIASANSERDSVKLTLAQRDADLAAARASLASERSEYDRTMGLVGSSLSGALDRSAKLGDSVRRVAELAKGVREAIVILRQSAIQRAGQSGQSDSGSGGGSGQGKG